MPARRFGGSSAAGGTPACRPEGTPALPAPNRGDGVGVVDEVAVLVGVVRDHRAVEAVGGHGVERHAPAVDVEHLVIGDRLVGEGQTVAAAAAAGREGDAEHAAVEVAV